MEPFLAYAIKNLDEYQSKVAAGEGVDWRIKEALMFSIATIREHIWKSKDLNGQMEQMLIKYILPELNSE